MILISSWRFVLLALATVFPILMPTAPLSGAPMTTQSFELKFTLADITEVATGQTIDPFLLQDLQIFGSAAPGFISINNNGNGTASSNRAEFFNGAPLGPLDEFEPAIGDMFSTIQTNNTGVPVGAGQGQLFETFAWDISVENSTFEDLQFIFDWEYTRTFDLVRMDVSESATVFLDQGNVSIDDFEGFQDSFEIFPDQLLPGNNPLNIGTGPPGFMTTLTDNGTFTLDVNGVDSQSSAISIEWQIGARSQAIPEPSAVVLISLALGMLVTLRRQ